NRTMAQMLQAPIEGYEDAIVIPQINANNFELKQMLINLVQSNQFTGRRDLRNHLRFFNKVTSTFRHPEIAASLEDKLDIRMNRRKNHFLPSSKNQIRLTSSYAFKPRWENDPGWLFATPDILIPFQTFLLNLVKRGGKGEVNRTMATTIEQKWRWMRLLFPALKDAHSSRRSWSLQMCLKFTCRNSRLRNMLHICPRVQGQTFAELPFEEEILDFIRDDFLFSTIKQESSSVSSQFVTNMLNPTSDAGMESIFATASTSMALLPITAPTMTPSTVTTITTTSQAPIPPTSILSEFAGAVSSIPGIVQHFMDQRMNEAVQVTVRLQSDRLREEAQKENDEFLRTAVNEQLEAEVFTRSSHSSRTSYDVVADLSEMELKKILIEKMKGNKSIQCSDAQRNLYKALVDAYESDKIILDTYGENVTLKRRRDDDEDKDEEPFVGPDRGSKRRREGKEPQSASTPLETATRSACRVDTLTPELLAGPTFELMKGSCKSLIELEHHLEDVYKATTDQLDWINPDGQRYPHNLLQPLPLIPNNRGRCVIPFAHFINNDLEYLRGGAFSRKYTTSVTKTKAADYGQIKWIEDLVPRTIRRIIAVTDLKIVEWHSYKHLDWITVRRDNDKLYNFKEGDFKRLRLQDIEDMLLLLLQGKLTNVTIEERFTFNVSFRMFTRSIVIQRRVRRSSTGSRKLLEEAQPYEARYDKKNRLMRNDELHKFSDGTLNDVRTTLDDRLKGIRMQYLPQTIWRKGDKDRASTMIQAIDKMLKTRRIMRSLEKFVGGRLTMATTIEQQTALDESLVPSTKSEDEGDGKEDQCLNIGEEERLNEEEEADKLYRDTTQFVGAVSTILGIVQYFMDQRMNEAVQVAVRLQSDRLREEAQKENDEFLRTVDENIKKNIKEKVKDQVKAQVSKILPRIEQAVNEQLKTEVLTRSSHSSRTSYAVAADLSEMKLKKILIEKMEGNKSFSTHMENCHSKRRRDDDEDKDEEPSAGPDQGSKRRREGKEPESSSTPSDTTTKSADRSTTGSRSRLASASESAFAEEPVQTTSQMEEPSHPKFETGADDQPIVQSSQHPEWFSQPKKPPTPDRDWNKTLPAVHGSIQPWISELAKQADSRSSFNELLDTPLDFSNFIMNRLKVDTLTPELLAGPTYELIKGCKSLIELEYHLEEVYKATTDQLDWVNPEGQQYPHIVVVVVALIPDNRGRRVIPFAHFINNDLEYLRGGAFRRKYTTSVTKTKAADYEQIKWIEDLVPRTMWIQEPIDYDKHALWGVSLWGRKRQQFYCFAVNRESALGVYSKRRIIAVTDIKIVEWHSYKHLDWITVRRDDDKLYKFKEGHFKRLRLQDIEDMLLLLVQGKLTNLTVKERFAFNVSLRMFTRSIVI
nr:reverse transcriptase domain-containing protein [Tanacetum cinerariifolium]